jgi:hypothetical protein
MVHVSVVELQIISFGSQIILFGITSLEDSDTVPEILAEFTAYRALSPLLMKKDIILLDGIFVLSGLGG